MATNTWPLAEAKAKFSEVLNEAKVHGPQEITRHGKREGVLISGEEFDRLKDKQRSLSDVLMDPRFYKSGLELERFKNVIRPVEF